MNHWALSDDERRALRETDEFCANAKSRMRTRGILQLSLGLALQKAAAEPEVFLNSVEKWRQPCDKLHVAGLYEGWHTGRPRKWSSWQQQALCALALDNKDRSHCSASSYKPGPCADQRSKSLSVHATSWLIRQAFGRGDMTAKKRRQSPARRCDRGYGTHSVRQLANSACVVRPQFPQFLPLEFAALIETTIDRPRIGFYLRASQW